MTPWEEELRAQGYPKRLIVDGRNKNAEAWQRFFDTQYESECRRYGIEIAPIQNTLL